MGVSYIPGINAAGQLAPGLSAATVLATLGINLANYIPYTGANANVDLGSYAIQAAKVFVGGSTGPLLKNSAGTIQARTNSDLADAPISASNGTFSGTVSAAAGSFSSSLSVSNNIDTFQLILSNAVRLRNAPTYGDGELSVLGGADSTQLGKIRVGAVHIGPTTTAGSSTIHANLTTTGTGAAQLGTGTTVGAGGSLSLTKLTASGDLLLSTLNSSKLGFGTGVNTNITTQASGFLLYNAPYGGGSATHYFRENGTAYLQIAGAALEVQGTRSYIFSAGAASSCDIALYRIDANTLEVNNRTAGTQRDLRSRGLNPMAAIFTSAGLVGADGLSLYRSAGWGIGFDGNGWPGVAVNNVHKLRLGTSVVIASDGFFGATSVTNTGTNNAATVTLSRYDNTTWQMGSADTANDTGGLRLTNLTSLGVLNQRLQSSTAAPNTTTLPSGATWWQDTVGNTRRFAYNDTGVIYLSPLLKSSIPSTPVTLADVIAVLQHWGLAA